MFLAVVIVLISLKKIEPKCKMEENNEKKIEINLFERTFIR